MSVTHAIIHQLTQTSHAEKLGIRDQELEQNDSLNRLIAEVKGTFHNRSSRQYGRFHDESGHFKTLVQQWVQGSIEFTAFTEKATTQLQNALKESKLECDGHWLFAVEKLEQGQQLWFFHLKHKQGLYLTDNSELAEGALLDFARLGFGACLNIQGLESNESEYLTVSFGFGDRALQPAVLEFVNFTDTVDTSADTEKFMAAVKAYTEQLPSEQGTEYRKKAAQYCTERDKLGETVVCQELSKVLVEDLGTSKDETLISYIEQQQPETKKEFIPDRKSLKKYMRYTGKSKQVSISFSNESLGTQVEFDAANETLIIRALPSRLLKQLKES